MHLNDQKTKRRTWLSTRLSAVLPALEVAGTMARKKNRLLTDARAIFHFETRSLYRQSSQSFAWAVLLLLTLFPNNGLQAQTNQSAQYLFTTLAGKATADGSTNGIGGAARFSHPAGIAVDPSGIVYVTDSGNNEVQRILPTGLVKRVAGSTDGTYDPVVFAFPLGIAVDHDGNIYVADAYNNDILKIAPDRTFYILAGAAGTSGRADGIGAAARFNYPHGIAVDAAENIYVADSNNNEIRKITPDGVVTTLAGVAGHAGSTDGAGSTAQFNDPEGVAVDGAGNLYIADANNHEIRMVTPDGFVTTLAGSAQSAGSSDGIGSAALFNYPAGIAVDGSKNLYVTDFVANVIRKIGPDGSVTSLGIADENGGSVDGTEDVVKFYQPYGIAVDSANNIYIADYGNDTIRKGTLLIAPTFSTQPNHQSAALGGITKFNVVAAGSGPFSYQWQRLVSGATAWTNLTDGLLFTGSTTDTITLTGTTLAMNGDEFRCIVTAPAGSVTSDEVALSVLSCQLVNISTRSFVGAGDNIQIAGFVITGNQAKQVLIRASGPSLGTTFALTGVLSDPVLRVFQGQNMIYSNTEWDSAENSDAIKSASARVGAFTWADKSKDSALLLTLQPGAYTVQVSGRSGDTGIALIEVYDADPR